LPIRIGEYFSGGIVSEETGEINICHKGVLSNAAKLKELESVIRSHLRS